MVSISDILPTDPVALDFLQRSVAFTKALYPVEENGHCFDIEALLGGRFFLVSYEQPIGCGGYVWLTATDVELRHIFLDEAARGKGCGRLLLSHMEQAAHQDGASKILLETTKKQKEAITLYERFGYAYRDPYLSKYHADSIFMEKLIKEPARYPEISVTPSL